MSIEHSAGPSNPVWVQRTGVKTFTGHNPRGATVQIASSRVDGEYFTPGELLKVALAACSAVSAEAPLTRALGEDFDVEVRAAAVSDKDERRYPAVVEELLVDLSGLDDAARARVLTVVQRAIEGHCTVGRTLNAGASVALSIYSGSMNSNSTNSDSNTSDSTNPER